MIISAVFFLLSIGAFLGNLKNLGLEALAFSESALYIYVFLAVVTAWLGFHTKKRQDKNKKSGKNRL